MAFEINSKLYQSLQLYLTTPSNFTNNNATGLQYEPDQTATNPWMIIMPIVVVLILVGCAALMGYSSREEQEAKKPPLRSEADPEAPELPLKRRHPASGFGINRNGTFAAAAPPRSAPDPSSVESGFVSPTPILAGIDIVVAPRSSDPADLMGETTDEETAALLPAARLPS